MKKTVILSAIFLFSMVLASCKPEKKEWKRFFGYTPADLVGEYHFSNASDAFSGLVESDEGIVCKDAEVSVSLLSEQTVNFGVNCPDHNYQKSFLGRPTMDANTFNVSMFGGWNSLKRISLSAEVLLNIEQGNIRLVGFVCEDHHKRVFNSETEVYDTVFSYSVKRYFDVINN